MQFSTLTLVAAAAVVSAQTVTIADIPSCALGPATASIPKGCAVTDFKCICSDKSYITSLTPKVQAACSPADIATTLKVSIQLCAQAGVTISVPGTSSSSSASSVTSSSSASEAAAATTSSTAAAATTTAASIPPPAPAGTGSVGNGSVTTASPSAGFTGAASAISGSAAAAGFFGVLALVFGL